MAFPHVPYTFTDAVANDVTAARLNALGTGIRDAQQGPFVRVFHNASQSIVNSTLTTLAFNSERFDQAFGSAAAQHDNVTNNSRLTALYAGVYLIGGSVRWSASPVNAEMHVKATLATVGTTIASHNVVADNRYMTIQTAYVLAVNDYVELQVLQISGGAINITSVGNSSPEFWMVRVA